MHREKSGGDKSVSREQVFRQSAASVDPESSSPGGSSEQTGGRNNVSEGKRSIGNTVNFMHKGIQEAPESDTCLEENDEGVGGMAGVRVAFFGGDAVARRLHPSAGRLSLQGQGRMEALLRESRLLPQSSHVSSDLQEELGRSDINHLALTERSQVPLRQKDFDGATKGVSSLRAKGEPRLAQAKVQAGYAPGRKHKPGQVPASDGAGSRTTQPKRQLASRQKDPGSSKPSTFLRDSLTAGPGSRDAKPSAEKPLGLGAASRVEDPQSGATTPIENLSRSGDTEDENLGNANYMESAREDTGVGNLSINNANLQIKQPNPLSSILTMNFNNSSTNFPSKPEHARNPTTGQQGPAPKRSPKREVKFKLVGGGRESSGPAEAVRPSAVKPSPNKQSRVSMVPQVNVGARRERNEPVFEEENCLPSDSHRRINKVTLQARAPPTFMLAMNRCNSEVVT